MIHVAIMLLANVIAADPLTGTVVGKAVEVKDGDSITVQIGEKKKHFILYGIDAPELNQAFGDKAKEALEKMILDKEVRIEIKTHDKNTPVALVFVDGKEVNMAMIESGMAWWSSRYAAENTVYGPAMAKAKTAKKGLWADKNAIPPWRFRLSENPNASSSHRGKTDATKPPKKSQ